MEYQLLGSVIYVAVTEVDGTRRYVEQMFRGISKTSFHFGGMTFSWLGGTLTVTGANREYRSIAHLDKPVEIRGPSGATFLVAVFPTEPKALAFLAKPVKTSAAA